jgi:hypothetical protein
MKKLIIAAFIAVSLATTAFAADVNKVNSLVLNAFNVNFADVTDVQWTLEKNFARARFLQNGEKIEAFFNYDGTEIGTSKVFALDKLPKTALRTFTKKYPFPPYKLKECIEFTDADGEVNYFISLEEEAKAKTILKVTSYGLISVFKTEKTK